VYEGFLLSYDSNSCAYHVFNKDSGCVEITCDAMFDETNGSQEEQVDLDLIDDEEALYDALQRMAIGDVRPQDPSELTQDQSPCETTPPAQGLDQDYEENQDEHEGEDEHHDQVQEESNDQGRDEDDEDKEKSNSRAKPPHPRERHNVQRDHSMNNILGDIEKEVTTRSRVANFCEHYSFVSSFDPFKVEDALHDLDWVVAMQEDQSKML
jgi:hypothetical protein